MKKLIGIGLMLTFVLGMIVSAPTASAYSENITIGSDLAVGSTGNDVVVLQGLMSELGFLDIPIGITHGYFGNMTKDAVARYQTSQGVVPTAGYYGPVTKTAMRTHFAAHSWLTLLNW